MSLGRLLPLPAALLAAASPLPAMEVPALRAAAEAAVGAPVRLDPRLAVPDCPGGFRFEPGPSSVRIHCPASGFALVAPVAREAARMAPGASPAPLVRRGELVRVERRGTGFAVSVEAIAEANGAPGQRIGLRNRSSGARLAALVMADGSLVALN